MDRSMSAAVAVVAFAGGFSGIVEPIAVPDGEARMACRPIIRVTLEDAASAIKPGRFISLPGNAKAAPLDFA